MAFHQQPSNSQNVPGRKRKGSLRAKSSVSSSGQLVKWSGGQVAAQGKCQGIWSVGGGAGTSPNSRVPSSHCFLSLGTENWCQGLTGRETSNYNYKFTFQIKSHTSFEIEPD